MFVNILKSIAWVALYFLASMIGTVVAIVGDLLINGFNWPANSNDVDALADAIIELILKTAVPGLIFASIICIIVFVVYKKLNKETLDIKKIEGDRAIFSIGFGLVLNVAISLVLALLSSLIPQSATDALDTSLSIALNGNFFVLILGTGILVPIMEEIIFRHGMHKTISQSNIIVGYIVSALVFGIMHGNIIQGAYAAILGFIFAVVLTKTDNIWYPILMHMAINSSSTIAMQVIDVMPELTFMVLMAIIGLAIVIPMLFRKNIRDMFIGENKIQPVVAKSEGEENVQ